MASPEEDNAALAIRGGEPVRKARMPARLAFGEGELRMIQEVFAFYRAQNVDPGYQGHFEKLYTDAFVRMMGGGYADAVATGTAALFVALAALDLPPDSEVLCSPITDPGTLSAIILNRLRPKLVDSRRGSYNVDADQVARRIGPRTSAAVIVHSAGQACDVEPIAAACRERGVKVLEDCSQAHGARVAGRQIGTFGDIAAFSTMYRKAHITGSSGGVVYTRDLALFRQALAHADRGKPRWIEGFDDRDPNTFLFPALNHHTDEISCAVGVSSLSRLADTIVRRLAFVADVSGRLAEEARLAKPYGYSPGDSPFFYPIVLDLDRLSCSKIEFARAVQREGIDLNPHYQYVVADWNWVKPHLADNFDTPNARDIRDRSFNLYLNENYGEAEAADAAAAILKVERYFTR